MKKQFTLGDLIRAVGSVPAETPVVFKDGKAFGSIGAYRGNSDDLAVSARGKDADVTTADSVLVRLACVINEEVGENECLMTADTLIWRSQYGEMEQKALIGAKLKDGRLVLKTKKREMDY